MVKVFGKFYIVESEGRAVTTTLRGRLRQDPRLDKYSDPVVVGDHVDFDLDLDGEGSIREVLPRTNVFTRKYKNSRRDDLIAANIDRIVVIQCFGTPRLNPRFVDRLLVRGIKEGIPLLLCVNKLDLAEKGEIKALSSYYRGYDLSLRTTSAVTGEGVRGLKKELAGRLSILIGNSGVGKTSLLNAMYPDLDLRTREVSESTGKGRHATTNVEMFRLDDETRIIDTPGLREFGLVDIEPRELGVYFMEFGRYADQCSFSPCTHDHEPGCEVKRLVEEGIISEERYVSYLNILASLREYRENRYR